MGTVGPRAVRALGAATGVRALGRRSLPVRRSLPGLARGAQRLHRPDRRAACRRRDLRAPRHRRHARGRRRARAVGGRGGRRLTCPLDVFCGQRFGALGWRGIHVASVPVPHVDHAQGAMVVNYPGFEVPLHPHPRDEARVPPAVRGDRPGLRVRQRAEPLLPPSRASATGRSTTATSPTCASRSARSGCSLRAAWPTTFTSTWTTACVRRSTSPRARCSGAARGQRPAAVPPNSGIRWDPWIPASVSEQAATGSPALAGGSRGDPGRVRAAAQRADDDASQRAHAPGPRRRRRGRARRRRPPDADAVRAPGEPTRCPLPRRSRSSSPRCRCGSWGPSGSVSTTGTRSAPTTRRRTTWSGSSCS